MTDELHVLLAERADRARPPEDPGRVAELVAVRAGGRTRTRRNRVAVASGAAVVAAAATVALTVADTGTAPVATPVGTVRHGPISRRPGSSTPVPRGRTATELPVLTPLQGVPSRHGVGMGPLVGSNRASLVAVAPAPRAAEISLRLVPKGFEYLGHSAAETFYGSPGVTRGQSVSDGIVVDVHRHVPGSEGYTLTVHGRRASYLSSDDGVSVRVRYSSTIDIGFRASITATLSRRQALKMAASLDVRSVAHTTST